jgi:ATP-dependent DNA ligase
MLKNCDSRYDVKGGRKDWAKLKKGCRIDNEAYQAIELDLVLMGVEQGRGKRKNFFGSYLFGAPH